MSRVQGKPALNPSQTGASTPGDSPERVRFPVIKRCRVWARAALFSRPHRHTPPRRRLPARPHAHVLLPETVPFVRSRHSPRHSSGAGRPGTQKHGALLGVTGRVTGRADGSQRRPLEASAALPLQQDGASGGLIPGKGFAKSPWQLASKTHVGKPVLPPEHLRGRSSQQINSVGRLNSSQRPRRGDSGSIGGRGAPGPRADAGTVRGALLLRAKVRRGPDRLGAAASSQKGSWPRPVTCSDPREPGAGKPETGTFQREEGGSPPP